jgi:Mn-dependent DtxR family transcriptional regulator
MEGTAPGPVVPPEGIEDDPSIVSPAVARYIRTIYVLAALGQRVQGVQVARRLGVSPAGVSAMLARIARDGLVSKVGPRGIVLSASGRREGRSALRRYCVARRFLTAGLGLDWWVARREAERFAAALTPTIEAAMSRKIEDDATCPHLRVGPVRRLDGADCPVEWACLFDDRPDCRCEAPSLTQ